MIDGSELTCKGHARLIAYKNIRRIGFRRSMERGACGVSTTPPMFATDAMKPSIQHGLQPPAGECFEGQTAGTCIAKKNEHVDSSVPLKYLWNAMK